jgi:hypothetical protein
MVRSKKANKAVDKRKYVVYAALDNFQLAKAKSALTLLIYRRGEKAGQLLIGRGSLYWRGGDRKSEKRIAWGRFAETMDELAYGEARTRQG